MSDDPTLGGMDAPENAAPPAPLSVDDAPEQQSGQPRDDTGRFAPRGSPSEEHASRRYAQERDEARREAQDAKANFERLQARLDDMAKLAKGDEAPPEAADPLKPLLEKVEGIDKRLTERDQAIEAERTWEAVRSYADQDEARFKAATPDFPNAVQHYVQSRLTEMKYLGVPEAQASEALQQEAQQLLFQAAQTGGSPSQILYGMAQARGYQPGAQPNNVIDMQPRQQPQNVGGRSFGNGAGAPGGGMTGAAIAAMSDEDYTAFRSTPEGRRAIKQMMGG